MNILDTLAALLMLGLLGLGLFVLIAYAVGWIQ